jgi:imidazole glycerol-phosphate synthase subunit HisF
MLRPRVIPCLLLQGRRVVKTVKFREAKYVGDPVNAVRIFSEKEVDELAILDIDASIKNQPPDLALITEIASECFMPLAYGGGIKTVEQIRQIFYAGVEKVVINSEAALRPQFIREAAETFGSQSIIVSIDVHKTLLGGYELRSHGGRTRLPQALVEFATLMAEQGAGEILLNSIDRDGTMAGYDIPLIKRVSTAVTVPVIAAGGAGCVEDLRRGLKEGGASAVAAGSLFVFHGKHRAVLMSYPADEELQRILD